MLQRLENRAARIVTNSGYDSSASALMKILKWPKVADMIKMETACMVYKSINDLAQDYRVSQKSTPFWLEIITKR